VKNRILSKNKGCLLFLLPKIYQLTEYYTTFARKIFFLPNFGCPSPPPMPMAYTTGMLYFSFLRRSICYCSCIFHSCIFHPAVYSCIFYPAAYSYIFHSCIFSAPVNSRLWSKFAELRSTSVGASFMFQVRIRPMRATIIL